MRYLLQDVYTKILSVLYPDGALEILLGQLGGVLPPHTSFYNLEIAGRHSVSGVSLSNYADVRVKELIHSLKYTGDSRVVELIATSLREYLLEYIAELSTLGGSRAIQIVPIPLSPNRLKSRGFNQLQLLLEQVSREASSLATHINCVALVKYKDTRPQTHLSRAERLENIKGVFKVANKKDIERAHIILIDDVLTTGATVTEAAKVLLQAGAAQVDVVTIARAL